MIAQTIELAAPALILVTIIVTLFRVRKIQNGEMHYYIANDNEHEK